MRRRVGAPLLLACAAVLLTGVDSYADGVWKVAHWNVLHGWGRYWDVSSTETNPANLYPPTGPFSAISDDGSAPNGKTYNITTTEPTGCGTAPNLATWMIGANGPMQTLLRSSDLANDPTLVAMGLSEGQDCISASAVKNALAAGNSSWTGAKFVQSGRDGMIAKYGWASGADPSMTQYNATTNPGGDVLTVGTSCTGQTKYQVIHGFIYTDAARTPANAVHYFETRIQGDNTCETADLDAFIRAKTGSGRAVLTGDFNAQQGSAAYNDLIARGYVEAGSSPTIPAGSDKAALTCCYGNDATKRTQNPAVHTSRIDLGFTLNFATTATSYWVGNRANLAGQEVAMSDHAVIKIGFTDGTPPPNTNPVIDTPLTANPNPGVAGQTVTLTVQAHDPENDPLSYAWNFGDGSPVSNGTSSIQHVYATAQSYTATVTITDGRGGQAADSEVVSVTCSSCGNGPPAPWATADIGAGVSGSTTYSNGTFTMSAGGSDIYSTSDAFHFVYQPWSGDGEIIANVAGFTNPSGAAFSLAAVMMRGSLTPSSAHASMMITNTGKAKFRRRATDGGDTISTGPSEGSTLPPRYLRLTRVGDVFNAYISADGTAWTPIDGSPATIVLPQTIYVGLVALRNGSSAPNMTATVDHVSLTMPDGWQSADIGAVGPQGSQVKSADSFEVTAGGIDVYDTADAFRFVYRPMSGDGEVVADITGLPLPPGAAFSLAGVMIRADLTPGSVHATMMTTTQTKAKFRRRLTPGGTTASDGPTSGSAPFPCWVRLTRVGNTFTAYLSTDGVNWGSPVAAAATIAMPANVYVGLVTLRNGASAGTVTATFDHVRVP